MSWGMVAVAGASLVGGAVASKSAKSAANTQAASADRATQVQKEIADKQIALQREQFNRSVELQEPFRQTGLAAQNRLSFLLGIAPTGRDARDPDILTIRNRLLPQYMQRTVTPGLTGQALDAAVNAEADQRRAQSYEVTPFDLDVIRQAKSQGGESTATREWDLDAAVKAELAKSQGTGQPGAQGDGYGSLMRDFSMADYEADPGYQFRLSEGEKAIQRAASAAGRSDSGRAYKDLMRFNQGEASQEYGNAFRRFYTMRDAKLNPLQSLAGVGQTATNASAQAGQDFASGAGRALGAYGQSAGANITGAGNAQAAGRLMQGNALQNGINGAVSAWNRYQQPAAGNSGWGSVSGWGTGINPNSGEYMGSLEF